MRDAVPEALPSPSAARRAAAAAVAHRGVYQWCRHHLVPNDTNRATAHDCVLEVEVLDERGEVPMRLVQRYKLGEPLDDPLRIRCLPRQKADRHALTVHQWTATALHAELAPTVFPPDPAHEPPLRSFVGIKWSATPAVSCDERPRPTWQDAHSPNVEVSFAAPVQTWRRVPADMRRPFVEAAAAILAGYATSHDQDAVIELLGFVRRHLRCLVGSASVSTRAAHLRQQLSGRVIEQTATVLDRAIALASDDDRTVRAALKHIRDGYVGKAAKAIARDPPRPVVSAWSVLNDLVALHPDGPPAPPTDLRDAPRTDLFAVDAVRHAAASACCGAAPGPSGWTDELLASALEHEEFAADFAALMTDIANGEVSPLVRKLLTSARLIGLPKVPCGTRPIAMGETFLKLACTLAINAAKPELMPIFADTQFGAYAKGGAQEIVHRARSFCRSATGGEVIATFDFRNAFNAIHRSALAAAVSDLAPDLARLFAFEYGEQSDLLFRATGSDGETVASLVPSRCGTRQGSASGAVFFCLGIQHILDQVRGIPGVQVLAYMDDVTVLARSAEAAAFAADTIARRGSDVGLMLNTTKCEWLSRPARCRFVLQAPPPGESVAASFVQHTDALKLLGASIGFTADDERLHLESRLMHRHDDFFRRLTMINGAARTAILSRSGVPKLSYVTATHEPDVCLSVALAFDENVEHAWRTLAQVVPDEVTRTLAQLPVRDGGCGFARHTDIGGIVYEASRNRALGLTSPDLRVTLRLFNVQLASTLTVRSQELSRVVEQNALKGSGTWMSGYRATQASWHSAALRLRLHSPLEGAPQFMLCPGCHTALTCTAWMHHCIGCPRIDGDNSSARHAAVKRALKDVLRYARQHFDEHEPRIGDVTCPGCRETIGEDDWPAHTTTCELLTPALLSNGVRRSGPDVAYSIATPLRNAPALLGAHGDPDYVFADVTVISTAAPSHVRTPIAQLFAAKKAEKQRKYEDAAKAKNARLAVLPATATGHLGPDFVAEVKRITAFRDVSVASCLAALSSAVMAGSATALVNAEKALGLSPALPCQRDRPLLQTLQTRQDALPSGVVARLLFDRSAAAADLFSFVTARLSAASRTLVEVEAPHHYQNSPHMPQYALASSRSRTSSAEPLHAAELTTPDAASTTRLRYADTRHADLRRRQMVVAEMASRNELELRQSSELLESTYLLQRHLVHTRWAWGFVMLQRRAASEASASRSAQRSLADDYTPRSQSSPAARQPGHAHRADRHASSTPADSDDRATTMVPPRWRPEARHDVPARTAPALTTAHPIPLQPASSNAPRTPTPAHLGPPLTSAHARLTPAPLSAAARECQRQPQHSLHPAAVAPPAPSAVQWRRPPHAPATATGGWLSWFRNTPPPTAPSPLRRVPSFDYSGFVPSFATADDLRVLAHNRSTRTATPLLPRGQPAHSRLNAQADSYYPPHLSPQRPPYSRADDRRLSASEDPDQID
jgi:hypothetical protein